MSKLAEIKQRIQHLSELSARMKQQLGKLKGPAGEEMRKKAKDAGTRMGIGAGISVFGLSIIAVASVYIIAVIILLVNIALDRLWLSALIVVAGSLLIGAAVAAIGVGIARKAAKDMPKIGGDVVQELKAASEEMKKTVEDLQIIAKQEAEERQKQMKQMMEQAMKVAPIVIGAYVGYRVVKKMVRSRRTRKRIILEEWEED
ncbi:MAG: phage holin family protein [Actinobacteria bacterium]|nr:MAG: phage holin family protein [Actinomycetota bacterium]